jgi:hypothetical protein
MGRDVALNQAHGRQQRRRKMRLVRRLPMATRITISETSIRGLQSQTNKSLEGLDYRMPKSSSLGSTITPFLITNRSHIFFM